MQKNKKVIIGVSGGPDSMFLLSNLLKKKSNFDILVAHVNYNLRKESKKEEILVKEYCTKNSVKFYSKNCSKNDYLKYKKFKNKQFIYRMIRYDFFKKIAREENTRILYLGHNLDDFIETAIMQEGKSDDYLFYGIKEETTMDFLVIKRPLIKMFKSDIKNKMDKKNIQYCLDSSNNDFKYQRNRIRENLKNESKSNKKKIYRYYKVKNKTLESRRRKVENFVEKSTEGINVQILMKFEKTFQKNVLYYYFSRSKNFVRLNSQKMDAILNFVNKAKDSDFKLMEDLNLRIKDNILFIINK